MKKILYVAAFAVCAMGLQGLAVAADVKAPEAKPPEAKTADNGSTCESRAVEKSLAGAAKTSFLKKCEAEVKPTCEKKAIDKNGKALAGAAKTSFVKKCVADAHPTH
jgi:hypothetical protein